MSSKMYNLNLSKKVNTSYPTLKRAWGDSWKWLFNSRIAWIIAIVVCGVMGAIFVGDSIWERALAGFTGAIIAVILIYGIAFVVHLIITPSRIRRETRHNYIRKNASYISRIFGSPDKRKYLKILDILKSMVTIENEITDKIVGKRKLTLKEFNSLKKRFNEETKIPTLPHDKAIKIFLKGNVNKKIIETINKMGLQMIGDKPSEKQTEFFIQSRSLLDDCGIGLSNELGKNNKYTQLLAKFDENIPDVNDNTPDWIIFMLVYPSSFNTMYLYWYAIPFQVKKILFRSESPKIIADFQINRESTVNILNEYAIDSIEKI